MKINLPGALDPGKAATESELRGSMLFFGKAPGPPSDSTPRS